MSPRVEGATVLVTVTAYATLSAGSVHLYVQVVTTVRSVPRPSLREPSGRGHLAGRGCLAGRQGKSFGGADDEGAAPGVLGRLVVVGAGEHAGELRHADPPGGQADDQEHQVRRVEGAVG